MAIRTAEAVWDGDLLKGAGNVKLGSGAFSGKYSFATRFGDTPGTNPEELIGAAHAACYSMALAAGLTQAGKAPRVKTSAKVHIEKMGAGFKITLIQLETEAQVAGLDDAAFKDIAEKTKTGCPVSQALAATPIELTARLLK